MTEQNGHKEREQNGVRDGDAGFAALDATEPHFGSSALGDAVSFEPVAPPVEVGGFEALSFEAPAALAEPLSAGRYRRLLLLLFWTPRPLRRRRWSFRTRRCLLLSKSPRIWTSLPTLKQSMRGSTGCPRTKRHPQKRRSPRPLS